MLPAAENVQVVVRMRPKASSERGQPSLVSISGEAQVTCDPAPSTLEKMGIQNKASLSRTFTYDRAFGESTSQERLFNESVAPVVDEVLRGYSCTVFCYGQTGTGKTYTIERSTDVKTWIRVPFSIGTHSTGSQIHTAADVSILSAFTTPALGTEKEFYRLTVR